ncbi:hypothetical protein N7468_003312, partial [Penicillium chermesinum]
MDQASQLSLFQKIHSYSFETDPEFANGLAIILGHPECPATKEEIRREDDLVIQAKCFFFSRKESIKPPIDPSAYKKWLVSLANEPQNPAPTPSPTDAEPAYPSSFAHIVELITTGQPIPGIQEIPDTVLTGHDTSSDKPRRRKPWEKDEKDEKELGN